MFDLAEPSRARAVSRIAILAVISAGLASCSSDFSRFSEGGPYTSRPQASNEATGSIRQQQPVQPAPSHRVESAALAPPPSGPNAGGGAGMGSYQPAPAPSRPEYTGSVSAPPPAPRQQAVPQNWSWDGGTAVVVAQGETLDTISKRHGVPPSAILQANNMSHAGQLQPGQRLVIPRVQHQLSAAPQVSAPATRVAANPAYVPAAPAGHNAHVAAAGDTLYSLARHYRLTPMAIARANNVGLDHKVRIGERIVIPGSAAIAPRTAQAPQAAPVQQQRPAQVAQAQPVAPAPRVATKSETTPAAKPQVAAVKPQGPAPKIASAEPPATAHVVTPAADPLPESAPTGTAGGAPSASFRWPVRGRVITGFGPKASGGQNDGINVAVPEGTPIKAAEDGVVAYAGSELKGYGNLVLVRHSNGFVTAYAHASELGVKKGETIKRGQVIGKAGATGNVTSPQLHFEVRKGATPVDPTQYLTGG